MSVDTYSVSKQAILYARSATGESTALVRQLETCREWAQANGYAVVGEYSEVASGLAAALPEHAKAITQAQAKEAVLVCADPSRLTRNLNRFTRCLAGCKRQGMPVFFVSEGAIRTENNLEGTWRPLQGRLVKMTRS
jgi:DNA invertase Pin-like site-specific DNA recombinase